jgi:hypothetical protein
MSNRETEQAVAATFHLMRALGKRDRREQEDDRASWAAALRRRARREAFYDAAARHLWESQWG